MAGEELCGGTETATLVAQAGKSIFDRFKEMDDCYTCLIIGMTVFIVVGRPKL